MTGRKNGLTYADSGVDINARVGVGEPVFSVGHGRFQMIAGVVTSDFTAMQWLASTAGIYYVNRKPVRARSSDLT